MGASEEELMPLLGGAQPRGAVAERWYVLFVMSLLAFMQGMPARPRRRPHARATVRRERLDRKLKKK